MKRLFGAIAGGVLLALGASVCQAEEVGITDDTIKIGMFGPLTGTTSIYGYPINNGAIAVYNQANDDGGIHGRKIQVIHEDDGCDPAKARAAVKKLIYSDKVFMIHGGNCSAAVFAARDEFINAEVPFMVMAAAGAQISAPVSRYIFTTTTTAQVNGTVMLNFAKSIPGVKTIAIVKHANEWADTSAAPVMEGYEEAGLELVAQAQLDSRATDATTQVLSIKAANPDLTLLVLYPGEAAVFLRDAKKYGLSSKFLASAATLDMIDLSNRAGGLDGMEVYTVSYLSDSDSSDAMTPYSELFTKYFPTDKVVSLNYSGMSGAITVVDALKRAGPDLTRDAFIAALEATRDGDAGPAACRVTFTPDDHQGCKTGTVWTLLNGEVRNVGPVWAPIDR